QLREGNAPKSWLAPTHLLPLLLGRDHGLRIAALELLGEVFRDGDGGRRDVGATNEVMSRVVAHREVPPASAKREDGPSVERILDEESRLLSCIHGWLRAARSDDSGGPAEELVAAHVTALASEPPVDPGLRRSLLLLIMQASWREDQPRWQERALGWL